MTADSVTSRPPLATWMIPVLNGMPYLPLTLASIEAQTFSDFQVIVWDNGSTDESVEEARRWIPSRLPGTVVTDRRLPLGLARAAMVAECQTEFGVLIDCDDISEPRRLERQMAFMVAHPEVAVVGAQLRYMNAAGVDSGEVSDYPLEHEQIVQEMLRSNPIGQPAVLFRCSAVMAAGNYRDFSPVHVEDYDLWLRMAAMNFQLANMPEALVHYRIHAASTTRKSITAGRLTAEVNARIAEAAPKLFGCSSRTMRQLREKRHPLAILPLIKIARHLGQGSVVAGSGSPGSSAEQGRAFRSRLQISAWRSPIFIRAARQMVSRSDLLTRALLAIAATRTRESARE